jgi:hypothetical protein
MKRKPKTTTYILPGFWACPLINDDWSGLEEDEYFALTNWLLKNQPGYCVGCSDDEENFIKYHDASAFVMACNCIEFTFNK